MHAFPFSNYNVDHPNKKQTQKGEDTPQDTETAKNRSRSKRVQELSGGTDPWTQKQPKTGPGAEGGQTPGHKNSPKQVQELRGDTPQDTETGTLTGRWPDGADRTQNPTVYVFLGCKKRKNGKVEFSVTSYLPPKLPRANLPQKKIGRDETLRDLRPRAM